MADTRAVRVRFRGIVQGVGFRAHVQFHCRAARIAGWVRNLDDGSVEAELVGAPEQLEEALRRIRAGRDHQLASVDVIDIPATAVKSSSFEIRH